MPKLRQVKKWPSSCTRIISTNTMPIFQPNNSA